MATKADKQRIESKKKAVAAKIKELAPSIDFLAGMMDETKLDLILIALDGRFLPAEKD